MVELLNPPELVPPRGFAHGALAPATHRLLVVAGQIGWDSAGKLVSGDFVAQFAQALRNVATVVQAAGGRPEDVLSLRLFVTDKQRYLAQQREVGVAYREVFGRHYPAMALVQVADLLEDGALVEIEALAAVPPAGGTP
ncbi:MAG: RidA family protein [Myxococcales bacterium]|nr:RidA family protein [Myxococcota bacterium]MDW8283780.1 RidA family protein [Myxococcales bacterium]